MAKMRRDSQGRLHKVHVLNGVECYATRWTASCSGCTNTPEMTSPPPAGIGCEECGYTGKRRQGMWVPFNGADFDRLYGDAADRAEETGDA